MSSKSRVWRVLDEPIERELKHLANQKVIVDEMAELFRALLLVVANERRRVELHFEAKDLGAKPFVDGIARQVAWLVSRNHLFDLSNVLVLRGIEPCFLSLGRHDSGQLTRTRKRQRALLEGRLDSR